MATVLILAVAMVGTGAGVVTQYVLAQNPAQAKNEESRKPEQPKDDGPEKEITNSLGMKLVLIQPGKFMMGTPGDTGAELPHEVEITQPFYMGKYVVTQGQYEKVMGLNPSADKANPQHPVKKVSWFDAVEFCQRLSQSQAESRQGRVYRLPTEAEWEYCCRAGATTAYSFGDDPRELKDYAWYVGNSDKKTHPVGLLKPNAWGLYDMHGNVWEWCRDNYAADYYKDSPKQDPPGPSAGRTRVIRGGAWDRDVGYCRAAFRVNSVEPERRTDCIGFRVVLVAAGPARP